MIRFTSRVAGILLAASLLVPAFAQGVGQLGTNQIWFNTTSPSGRGVPTGVSSALDSAIGSSRGSILERGASGWRIVTPGSSGLPFASNGAGADPAYQAIGQNGLPSPYASGVQDTVLGYFASTSPSAVSLPNCSNALTYNTGTHAWGCNAGAGTGSVTTFSSGNLSPLFTTSVSNASTTPSQSFALSNTSDKTIYSNISGGSAAPQFNNAASVGASWVLLQSQAASNSTTIDFKNGVGGAVLDSTYDEYVITFTGIIPATNTQNLLLEVSTDGGSTWHTAGTDYKRAINVLSDAGTNAPSGSTGEAALNLTSGQSNNSGRPMGGNLYLFGPSASTLQAINWQMSYFDGTNTKLVTGGGLYTGGAAINGLRFLFSSGNITSGTFSLYGIRKV